jgi:hypothetical protein
MELTPYLDKHEQQIQLALTLERLAERNPSPFSTHLINEFGVMVDEDIVKPEVYQAVAELGMDTDDETLATQAFYLQDAHGKLTTQLTAVNRGQLLLAATWDGEIYAIKEDAECGSNPDWMMTILTQELRRKVGDGDEVEDRIEDTVGEIHMLASSRGKEIKNLNSHLTDAAISLLGHMGTKNGNAEKLKALISNQPLLKEVNRYMPLYQILHSELSDKEIRALRKEHKKDPGYLEYIKLAQNNSDLIKHLKIQTNIKTEIYPNLSYEDRESLNNLRKQLNNGETGNAYRTYASEILLEARPGTFRPWYEENEKPQRWKDATDPVPQVLGSIMMCQNIDQINTWCAQIVGEVENKLKIIEENNGYINHKRTIYDTPPKDLKVLHGHLLVEACQIPKPDLQLQYLLKIDQVFKEKGSHITAKPDIQRAWRTCQSMRTPFSENPDIAALVSAA